MCMCFFGGPRGEVCHLVPNYHASQLHPCLPLQNVSLSFLCLCSSVSWCECAGILGKAVLCMTHSQELQSYTSGPCPWNASHCNCSKFLYTFPVSCPTADSLLYSGCLLTNMIGSDSWLIDKVASCKGIIKKDIYITFYFNLKQLKVHSSLSFKKIFLSPKSFLWFVSSWCFRHFFFGLHNTSSVFSSLYKVEEEQHKDLSEAF